MNHILGRQVRRFHRAVDNSISASEHLTPQFRLAQAGQRFVDQRLVDRLGRKAQVARVPVFAIDAKPDSLKHHPIDFPGKRWLIERQVRKFDTQRRCHRALMSTTLRTQRNSRRCPGENHLGIDVQAVNQRIKTPAHERIVDRSNRDQRLPVQFLG
jgi:hypothetical protein